MEFREKKEDVEESDDRAAERPSSPGSSDVSLPASLRRRSDLDAIREDLRPYRGTTTAERSEIVSKLCRFAAEQIAAHPDGQRILEFQEQRPARSMSLWLHLLAEARTP